VTVLGFVGQLPLALRPWRRSREWYVRQPAADPQAAPVAEEELVRRARDVAGSLAHNACTNAGSSPRFSDYSCPPPYPQVS
jgi:hypothetical protein